MKSKIISVFIIVLIVMVVPIKNYAITIEEAMEMIDGRDKPKEEWDLEAIVSYYHLEGAEGFKNESKEVLARWVETYYEACGPIDEMHYVDHCYKSLLEEYLNKGGIAPENRELIAENMDVNYWKPTSTGDHTEFNLIAGKIVGMVRVVGSVVAVAMLIIIGIKYMLASVEEKAKYKSTLIIYLLGCALIFAIGKIASLLYDVAQNI